MGHARGAGQADRLADLAHRGRVAALLDAVLDVGEHALLARGQPGRVRRSVGELETLPSRETPSSGWPWTDGSPPGHPGSNICSNGVSADLAEGVRTIVRVAACVVRTPALTSYTRSIEHLIESPVQAGPRGLSVAASRTGPDGPTGHLLPQEPPMSTMTASPTTTATRRGPPDPARTAGGPRARAGRRARRRHPPGLRLGRDRRARHRRADPGRAWSAPATPSGTSPPTSPTTATCAR